MFISDYVGSYVSPNQNSRVGTVPPSNFQQQPVQQQQQPVQQQPVQQQQPQGTRPMQNSHAQYHQQSQAAPVQQQFVQQQPQQNQYAPQQQPQQRQGYPQPQQPQFVQQQQNQYAPQQPQFVQQQQVQQQPQYAPQQQQQAQQQQAQFTQDEANYINASQDQQYAYNVVMDCRARRVALPPIQNQQFAQSQNTNFGAVPISNSTHSKRNHGVQTNGNGDVIIDANLSDYNRSIALADCARNESIVSSKRQNTPEQMAYNAERERRAINMVDHSSPRDCGTFIKKYFPYKHSGAAIEAMRNYCVQRSMRAVDALVLINKDVADGLFPDCEHMRYNTEDRNLFLCTAEEIAGYNITEAKPGSEYSPMTHGATTGAVSRTESNAGLFSDDQSGYNSTQASEDSNTSELHPAEFIWTAIGAAKYKAMTYDDYANITFTVSDSVDEADQVCCRVVMTFDDNLMSKVDIPDEIFTSETAMWIYDKWMKPMPKASFVVEEDCSFSSLWSDISLIKETAKMATSTKVEPEAESTVHEEVVYDYHGNNAASSDDVEKGIGFDNIEPLSLKEDHTGLSTPSNEEVDGLKEEIAELRTVVRAQGEKITELVEASESVNESIMKEVLNDVDLMKRQLKLTLSEIEENHHEESEVKAKQAKTITALKKAMSIVIKQTGAQGFKSSIAPTEACSDTVMVTKEEMTPIRDIPSYTAGKDGEKVMDRELHRKFVTQNGLTKSAIKRITESKAPHTSTKEPVEIGKKYDSFMIDEEITAGEFVTESDEKSEDAYCSSKLILHVDNKNEMKRLKGLLDFVTKGDLYKFYLGTLACMDSVEKFGVELTLEAHQKLDKHLAGVMNDAILELDLDMKTVVSFLGSWGCNEFEGTEDDREAIRTYITASASEVNYTKSAVVLVSKELYMNSPILGNEFPLSGKLSFPMMLSSIVFKELYVYAECLMVNEQRKSTLITIVHNGNKSKVIATMNASGDVSLVALV